MRPYAAFAIVGAASFSAFACVAMDTRSTRTGTPLTAEKPFASGGRIEMQLDGGRYDVRPSADNRVRIVTDEHIGDAAVTVTAEGTNARRGDEHAESFQRDDRRAEGGRSRHPREGRRPDDRGHRR